MSAQVFAQRPKKRIRKKSSEQILHQSIRKQKYQGASQSEIIEMCLSGDERAWSEFTSRWEPRLFRFLCRMLSDSERAKDLVQDTFIRVFRHLPSYDPSKSFATWIYTIASNLARNEFRNRKRNPLISLNRFSHSFVLSERPTAVTRERNPEEQLLNDERMEIISKLIETLPEHHQEVLHWRYVVGMSYKDMADEADVLVGTIKSRLSRARESFQVAFEAYYR